MSPPIETGLTLLTAIAVQTEIEELLPRFRRDHGLQVHVNYDVNPAIAKRVMAGEAFDVGLNNPWYVEEMIAQGLVMPDVHVPFGRAPLAIGAAGSEPKELVTSQAAVRTLLAEARSIAYTGIGTSGKTFLRAIELMGLEHQLEGRLHSLGAGEPPVAAAQGRIQYAIAPLPRILAAAGVTPVAIFPGELGLNIDMSMFIHIGSKRPDQARQLVRYLADPSLDGYLRSHGLSRFELDDGAGWPSHG
jgi:molybdate transport system substrate-binding protein